MNSLDSFRAVTIGLTLTCIFSVGCDTPPMAPSPTAPVKEAAVDAAVAPYVGTQVPGLSVAVGYHGRVIFAKAYGKADLASGAPLTAQTRLGIGSVLKQMTSGALLTLQRDGLLSIDDKVNVLLPQYVYGNRMTLRQLSTMSSGLQGANEHPLGDVTFGIVGAFTGNSSVPQIYAKLNANPPIQPPGTKWDYANVGYWLLGRTIEAATKGTYAQAMQGRIFGPLGMKSAYIRGAQPDANLATGYSRFSDGTFHTCPELNLTTSDAAGMGAMTASDVIVWDEALRAQKLVGGALAKDMFTPNGLSLDAAGLPGDSYAMGWNTRNDPTFGYGIFDHEGNTNLYASINVLFPDGSDVVLLGNAQYNQYAIARYTIAYNVHNAIVGLPPVKPFKITSNQDINECQNE
ncbi:MAG: serine hydrolase domain-containing protein [Candidatus Baltobacteraceae bacterium]